VQLAAGPISGEKNWVPRRCKKLGLPRYWDIAWRHLVCLQATMECRCSSGNLIGWLGERFMGVNWNRNYVDKIGRNNAQGLIVNVSM